MDERTLQLLEFDCIRGEVAELGRGREGLARAGQGLEVHGLRLHDRDDGADDHHAQDDPNCLQDRQEYWAGQLPELHERPGGDHALRRSQAV